MKILAIETSCDETGIALVEGTKEGSSFSFRVLKSALLSQAALHAPYGGVFPNLAKREHQKNLPALFEQFKNEEFNAVAVTHGPGLEPALWQGIGFATELAKQRDVPLLPTNHMEGHLISSLAKSKNTPNTNLPIYRYIDQVQLPVLALLISGGHTEFVLMKEWFTYEVVGHTLDDAVGEAFDKVARMLGLPYPGGPHISKLAEEARQSERGLSNATAGEPNDFSAEKSSASRGLVSLPRPMIHADSCDVSFSGLKTAALYALRAVELSEDSKKAFAREFEDAVGDVLSAKTLRALGETEAKTFVIGGGVAANVYLREKLRATVANEFPDVAFCLPERAITGDNAIMIAEAALARRLSGLDDSATEEVRAVGNLSIAN